MAETRGTQTLHVKQSFQTLTRNLLKRAIVRRLNFVLPEQARETETALDFIVLCMRYQRPLADVILRFQSYAYKNVA